MANSPVHLAKARFSEVVERANSEGARTITRNGVERAVVLSIGNYPGLTAPTPDFKAHLIGCPRFDEFLVERNLDTGREVAI